MWERRVKGPLPSLGNPSALCALVAGEPGVESGSDGLMTAAVALCAACCTRPATAGFRDEAAPVRIQHRPDTGQGEAIEQSPNCHYGEE